MKSRLRNNNTELIEPWLPHPAFLCCSDSNNAVFPLFVNVPTVKVCMQWTLNFTVNVTVLLQASYITLWLLWLQTTCTSLHNVYSKGYRKQCTSLYEDYINSTQGYSISTTCMYSLYEIATTLLQPHLYKGTRKVYVAIN